MRTFEAKIAKRERVPLIVGLTGPSGGGKTGSALELATGIQDIVGGEIVYIDTEAKRALHYAEMVTFSDPKRRFAFKHVNFAAPFAPSDYMEAIKYAISQGAKTVVVDSMSHEHAGTGGVMELHDSETKRLAEMWKVSPAKTSIPAWNGPKQERSRLLNFILQAGVNFVFCYRAKEKIKVVSGKDPVQLGWQPIAGEEYVFEATVNCLLPPGANGVPEWTPEERAEKQMIKLPQQFRDILTPGRPLSIKVGQELATWARGDSGSNQQAPQPSQRKRLIDLVGKHQTSLTQEEIEVIKSMIPQKGTEDENNPELLTAAENKAKEFLERAGVTV